jgi:hypothetical protein
MLNEHAIEPIYRQAFADVNSSARADTCFLLVVSPARRCIVATAPLRHSSQWLIILLISQLIRLTLSSWSAVIITCGWKVSLSLWNARSLSRPGLSGQRSDVAWHVCLDQCNFACIKQAVTSCGLLRIYVQAFRLRGHDKYFLKQAFFPLSFSYVIIWLLLLMDAFNRSDYDTHARTHVYLFKLFISIQNYIRFYKLICCDSVWREEAYPKISLH